MFTQGRPHTEPFFGVPVLFIVPLLCLVTFGTRWAVRKFGRLFTSFIAYLPSASAQGGEVVVVFSLLMAVFSDIAAACSLTDSVANGHVDGFYWYASIIVDICGFSVLGLAVVILVEVFILGRLPNSPESLEVAKLMRRLAGLVTHGKLSSTPLRSISTDVGSQALTQHGRRPVPRTGRRASSATS